MNKRSLFLTRIVHLVILVMVVFASNPFWNWLIEGILGYTQPEYKFNIFLLIMWFVSAMLLYSYLDDSDVQGSRNLLLLLFIGLIGGAGFAVAVFIELVKLIAKIRV